MAAKEHVDRLIRIGKRNKQIQAQKMKRMELDKIRQMVFHIARPRPPAGCTYSYFFSLFLDLLGGVHL